MKNAISTRDFYFLTVILSISTIQIYGISSSLAQDNWIPVLLSPILAIPLMAMYARMASIAPKWNIFEMAEYAFGKYGGRVFHVIFSAYTIHVIAIVLYNIGTFAQVNSLPKTPFVITLLLILLPALYIAKSGTKTLGKLAFVVFWIAIFLLLSNTAFSIPMMNAGDLLPVMQASPGKILLEAAQYLPYPYGEALFLMAFIGDVQPQAAPRKPGGKYRRPYRNLILGAITSGLYLTVVIVRTIAVLGPNFAEHTFMSAFKAVSVLHIGSFLQRIEALMGMALLLFGMVKVGICIIAASRGLSRAVSREKTFDFTVPCAALGLALTPLLFVNNLQLDAFKELYRMYAPVIQILIPLAIWISMEIRVRKKKREQTPPLDHPVLE